MRIDFFVVHKRRFWYRFALDSTIIITIWYQRRQSKIAAKMNVFMDLVSFRNHVPLPWQFVVALNRIDIVFHSEEAIRRLWHEYYDLIIVEQTDVVVGQVKEKKVALISAIAHHLDYKGIDQIYLQRYYQTQGSYDDYLGDVQLKGSAMEYFQIGKELHQRIIHNMDNQKGEADSTPTAG